MAGGLIWFQHFKSRHPEQVVANIRSEQPTVATATATMQDWQRDADRGGFGARLQRRRSGGRDRRRGRSDRFRIRADRRRRDTVLLRLRPNDDEAKLAQLQANADLAERDAAAGPEAVAAHGVAQATVDTDAANLKVAQRAGRGAAGADGGEDRARAVRRPAWACGRSMSVSSSRPEPRS